ncbi:hypothetical protein MHYP_G00061170 [Metynnis hypsauchen]
MSFFSPKLISLLPTEAKPDPKWSSLLSEAEETAFLLNRRQVTHAESEWKLLVLFVPLDRQCLCNEQVSVLVREVDAALQVLHSKLEKAIISVALLDTQSNTGHLRLRRTCLCPAVQSTAELRLTTAIYSHVLLESLEHHLVEKKWYNNREDFTVQLQRVPLSDFILSWDGGASDEKLESETYKLVLQLWENLVMGTELPCENLNPSNTPPTSVHALRPADIQVVAALGDSITAGNGVGSSPYNLLDVTTQYRGLSWCVGGDQNLSTVTTLPNILREFNPALTGFSVDKGKEETSQAFLNQAVAGATSVDMLKQAQALVSRMKNDSRIDFHSDWKVITLFIGGNDLCDSCKNSLYYSAENFVKRVQEALDYLHSEVPRAVVNLVEPIHIIPLRGMHQDSSLNCPTWMVRILCPCTILPKNGSKALQDLDDLNRAYQRGLVDLVESGRYDTHSNFTVVLQPLLRDLTLPYTDGRPDRSFFSPDCFHLSQKAHTLMARGLWNNMLEPLGNKTYSQDFTAGLSVKCPSENSPFIQTYENSNYTYKGPAPTPPPISTGLGAKSQNYFQLNTEYKGVSWSIGGDTALETTTTLPNILRKFNPSVQGFSTGQGLFAKKGFNMAVSKAKVSDLSAQVSALIEALKSSQVPRVLVNVVTVPEMDRLRRIQKNSLPCMLIPSEKCPCFMLPEDNSVELTEIKLINLHYQTVTEQLISGGRYDGREDFAVVLQPYLQSTVVPLSKEGNPDLSYFTVDCLHLSERAHAEMAIALWNNMLEPVGKKQIFNNFTHDRTKIQCPSEAHPFIYTKMNSIPDYSTTPSPDITPQPIQPTQLTPCPFTVPVWVPAVFGVIGLLLGWGITWLFLWGRIKKMKTAKEPKETESELKGTSL